MSGVIGPLTKHLMSDPKSSIAQRILLLLAGVIAILIPAMTMAQSVLTLQTQDGDWFYQPDGNLVVLGDARSMTLAEAVSKFDHLAPGRVEQQHCDPKGCWLGMILESGFDHGQDITVIGDGKSYDLWIERHDGTLTQLPSKGQMYVRPASSNASAGDFFLDKGERVKLLARAVRPAIWTEGEREPAIAVQPTLAALEEGRRSDVMSGLLVGGLITLGLYNLLVALTSRSRSYYLYFSYLVFMAFSSFDFNSEAILTTSIFAGHPVLREFAANASPFLMWVSLVVFARSFLGTRSRLPRFDRLWLIPVVVEFTGFAMGMFGLKYAGHVSYIGFSIPAPLGIIAAILCLRQGYRPARYFLFAQCVLCIGELLQVANDYGAIRFDFAAGGWADVISSKTVFLGSLIDAILFSIALSDRMKALTQTIAEQTISNLRDRELLVNAQKEQLEIDVAQRTLQLSEEKQKSDQLLLSVLPAEIAAELKSTGQSRPRRYDDASILFTDFRNFTTTVSALPAARLVDELNEIFQEFDEILLRHGVEKIKTIGDSYLVAAGLPEPAPDHAVRCVRAALDMLSFIAARNQTSFIKWGMRAGVHSGSVVAGIVGKTKFAFDVFGDTVNIASRMESSSEPGRLNVSAYTYDLIKTTYSATYRGKIDMKGKGEVDMYFVDAPT